MPRPYDTVIIGAGITGCFTAYYLAKAGQRVLVCDRGKVASEQSSRAWGFIRQQGRHPAELPLMQEALGLWAAFNQEHGVDTTGHVREGVIVPAETEDDEKFVEKSFEAARALGLPTEILSANDLKARVPELAGQWRCGLETIGDGHAEPELSTRSVCEQARRLGVEFAENMVVTGFETRNGLVSGVRTGEGDIAAGHVLISAGVGTRKLLKTLGFDAPIQMVRSSVFQTARAPVFTRVAMWCPTLSFRPAKDGSFVIGNGYRGAGTDTDITLESFSNLRYFLPALRRNYKHLKLRLGAEMARSVSDLLNGDQRFMALPEPKVNHEKVGFNLRQFRKVFPHLGDIEMRCSWAGRLDVTPDLIPMIDRHETCGNVLMACGFSGHGFGIGPSVGKQLSEWICTGATSLDLSNFKYTRFRDGAYRHVDAM